MNSRHQIRVSSVVGMASAGLWLVALFIEYRFGLQPPGNGSLMYLANQAMFFVALAGYLILLLGLWKSKAAGDGIFGKISLGIFIAGLVSLLIAQIAQWLTNNPDFFLFPVGGILAAPRWTSDRDCRGDCQTLEWLAEICSPGAGTILPDCSLSSHRNFQSISHSAQRVDLASSMVHHEPGAFHEIEQSVISPEHARVGGIRHGRLGNLRPFGA